MTDTDKKHYVILDGGDVTAAVRLRAETIRKLQGPVGGGEWHRGRLSTC